MVRRIFVTILPLLFLLLQACTVTKNITYHISDVKRVDTLTAPGYATTKALGFFIEPFRDIRDSVAENDILFVLEREADVDGKHSCLNSEQHYKKGLVAKQLKDIMTKHFRKRGMFRYVAAVQKDSSDYYLTGSLRRLYGVQDFSDGAKVGSMFGLLGAIVTSGSKTNGNIVIEFTDLEIHRTSDGKARRLDNYLATYTGELHADADCWCMYDNINDQLRIAVDKLAPIVEQGIADFASGNQ